MDDTLPSPAGEPEWPEPTAYMFQDDETGRICFVDQWQISNGWPKANPRFIHIGALIRATDARAYGDARAEHARRVALEEAAKLCDARVVPLDHPDYEYRRDGTAGECATAIRALARKEGTK